MVLVEGRVGIKKEWSGEYRYINFVLGSSEPECVMLDLFSLTNVRFQEETRNGVKKLFWSFKDYVTNCEQFVICSWLHAFFDPNNVEFIYGIMAQEAPIVEIKYKGMDGFYIKGNFALVKVVGQKWVIDKIRKKILWW